MRGGEILIEQDKLIEWTERLISLTMGPFTGANGLLIKGIDARTGRRDTASIVCDLGDYAQYVAWYGKLCNKPRCVDWAVGQVLQMWQNCTHWRGLVNVETDTDDLCIGEHPSHRLLLPSRHDDLLLGLVEMYRITRDERLVPIVRAVARGLKTVAMTDDGCVSAAVWPACLVRSAVAEPRYCGLIAEEFVNMTKLGLARLIPPAERIIRYWIDGDFFEAHALVPDTNLMTRDGVRFPAEQLVLKERGGMFRVPFMLLSRVRLPRRIEANERLMRLVSVLRPGVVEGLSTPRATLMKNNTLLMFGLLRVYEATKKSDLLNVFQRWVWGVTSKLTCSAGGYYHGWDAVEGTRRSVVALSHCASMLEVLIEAYRVTRQRSFLNRAVEQAEFWMSVQSPRTGLVRDYPHSAWRGAALDANTDLAVIFLKLYEITKRREFGEAAARIAEGINNHFFWPRGLLTQSDSDTGGRTGSDTDFLVKVKWNTLHLKLLLLMLEMQSGRKLRRSPALWSLARDR